MTNFFYVVFYTPFYKSMVIAFYIKIINIFVIIFMILERVGKLYFKCGKTHENQFLLLFLKIIMN